MIRFGMLTWLPIYLLQVKGFSKAEMSVAFLFFEWAAIPSTIFAGYISDKFFKGYRMPPAIIAISIIFFCIFGYWQSESLLWVTFFAAIVGCLIYIPQFLASVQTMDIVPVSYTHLDVYKRQTPPCRRIPTAKALSTRVKGFMCPPISR